MAAKTITRPQYDALRTAQPFAWKRMDALDGRRLLGSSVRPATVAVLVRLGLVELVEVKNGEGETESAAHCLTRAGELVAVTLTPGGDLVRLDTIAYTVEHTVTVERGAYEWEGYSVVAVEGGFHIVPAGGGIPQTLHPIETVGQAVDCLRRQVNGKRWGDLTWAQLGAEHNDRIAEELGLPTAADVAYAEMVAAREVWETESPKFADAHVSSASGNADDTSVEEGFEDQSRRWFEVAVSTLHSVRDDAPQCLNPKDPEGGQALMIKGGTDYVWVDGVRYGNADHSASEITVVDRDGNRSSITPADVANPYGEEVEEAPQEAPEGALTEWERELLAQAPTLPVVDAEDPYRHYLTHRRVNVPVTPRTPLGIGVEKTEHATFADALAAATEEAARTGALGYVFCDAVTIGRTDIARVSPAGEVTYVNDYANPGRRHLAPQH